LYARPAAIRPGALAVHHPDHEEINMPDQPETTNPAAAVEVRDRCPHCGDHQLVPRVQMAEHLVWLHPEEARRILAGDAASGVQPDTRPAMCACDGQTLLEVHRPGGCYDVAPARPVPDTERRERYARAFFALTGLSERRTWESLSPLLRKVHYERADAALAVADEEQRNLREAYRSIKHRLDVLGGDYDNLRAELEQARRYRTAWLSARERAVAHSEGTLRVVKDRETCQGWLKAAQAELEQARAIPSHVWQVWREDGPVNAVYATVDDARQGSIDCWQETEPSCPDYSWAKDGPRLELVVGGERGGVYISRQPVYGRHLTAAGSGGQAEDGAQRK
jgi:hypothetical protein